jgi:hypothetical protein
MLIHLYQTSSLLPGSLPTVASASLRLLYTLLNSKHINHIQVLGFPGVGEDAGEKEPSYTVGGNVN